MRLKYFLLNKIKNDQIIYAVLALLLFLGICIGAFWVGVMPVEIKGSLKSNVGDYFLLTPDHGFNSGKIFKLSMFYNVIPAIVLYIVSIKYIGVILAPPYIVFRGFCLGFSIAFLTESFGRRGFILTLISILPQNIIYIPSLVLICYISINLSIVLFKLRKEQFNGNKNKNILKHLTYSLVVIAAIIVAGLIEAYITPVFLKTLITYL